MKQHITLQQWNELSQKQKEKYVKKIYGLKMDFTSEDPEIEPLESTITIGQIIEFLGDDWAIAIMKAGTIQFPYNKKLCDALWEACKEKLK